MFRSRKKNKESKVTERALYASLFSMVLCCAMLLETTYAWFTQEISTGVAVIQTGEMSVELVIENGVDENGVTYAKAGAENLRFKAADTTAVQATAEGSGEQATGAATSTVTENPYLFQPGGVYELPTIYVMNTGNIDVKYMLTISFAGASTKKGEEQAKNDLLNAITFEAIVGGETGTTIISKEENKKSFEVLSGVLSATEESKKKSVPIVIRATMNSDVGTEYADLNLEGIQIIVTATQTSAPDEELILKSTESDIYNGSTENTTEQGDTMTE